MGITLSILIFLMTLGFVIMKDKELKNTCPNCKSFRWGYFIGCFFFITAAANIFLLIFGANFFLGWVGFIGNLMNIGRLNPGAYFIYLISVLIFSYLIIERHKAGWIVGSVLFFNPIIWVINFFYGKKRWSEFDGYINIKFFELITKKFFELTSITRIFILSPVLWIAVVLSFIYIFQPYGYIDSREEIKILKILFIPPVVFLFGLFLYKIALHKK
jgi:hypothetical protein